MTYRIGEIPVVAGLPLAREALMEVELPGPQSARVSVVDAITAYADRNIFTGGTLTSTLNEAPPITLASATTVNVGSATSNTVIITGTTNISAFDAAPVGAIRRTMITGVFSLVNNSTSFKLQGGGNIVTQAGDTAEWISLGGGNWQMTSFSRPYYAVSQAASTNSTLVATTAFVQVVSGRPNATLAIASGVLTITVAGADFALVTLNANVTSIVLSSLYEATFGMRKLVKIIQGASTAYTVAWPSSFKWPGGVTGTVSTALGAVDELEIHSYDGGTSWQATLTKGFA